MSSRILKIVWLFVLIFTIPAWISLILGACIIKKHYGILMYTFPGKLVCCQSYCACDREHKALAYYKIFRACYITDPKCFIVQAPELQILVLS